MRAAKGLLVWGDKYAGQGVFEYYVYDKNGNELKHIELEKYIDYLGKKGIDTSGHIRIENVDVTKGGILTFIISGENKGKYTACLAQLDLNTGKVNKKAQRFMNFFAVGADEKYVYGYSVNKKTKLYSFYKYSRTSKSTRKVQIKSIKASQLDRIQAENGNMVVVKDNAVYYMPFKTCKFKKLLDLKGDKFLSGKKWSIADVSVVNKNLVYVAYQKQFSKGGAHSRLEIVKYSR